MYRTQIKTPHTEDSWVNLSKTHEDLLEAIEAVVKIDLRPGENSRIINEATGKLCWLNPEGRF